MKSLSRLALCVPLAFVAVLYLTGSNLNGSHLKLAPGQPPSLNVVQAAGQNQADQAPPDQGPDPANANIAPSGQSYTTEAPPPGSQNPDDSGYAEQPTATATEPPPPLPDYAQPPAPGDGYIWTPGYWAWGPYGYYWVPGVWVEPPYAGGLWTPGYWGFYGGSYLWYPGHWGYHMGWYGGINYGFGYIGFGYEGGYWNRGHFFYNRVYNHIDERNVHNVYSYRANVHVNTTVRSSYRGGTNGVQAHPRPQEGAAYHEPTAPRMSTQAQHEQNYSTQRGQYAVENHGKPATPAESRPLRAEPNVKPQQRSGSGGQSGGHSGGQSGGRH